MHAAERNCLKMYQDEVAVASYKKDLIIIAVRRRKKRVKNIHWNIRVCACVTT